jgi:hypothetical protein
MARLPGAVAAWNTPDFDAVLKREVAQLPSGILPLQQAMSFGSHALDDGISVMILGAADAGGFIQVRAGIFFSGIVAGCNCADDPTPVDALSEYCELLLAIDKDTAEAAITLAAE